MKASCIILSLLICFLQPAAAQSPDYHIQIIKGSNILNSNQVEQIMTDDKGFLWLLSPSRVQRFDGKNFKIFSFDDRCGSIEQDASGNIWVLARNHIYVKWSGRAEFEDKTPAADEPARYRRLLAGPGGKLFMLANSGIKYWNEQKAVFEPSRIPAFTSRENFPFLKSFGNYLFFAHSNKLFRYDVSTGKQDSIACRQPNYLFPINQDSVWVREGIGKTALVSFVSSTVSPISPEQFEEKFDNDVFFVTGGFRSAPGEFFVAILNKGYFMYNAGLNRFKKATLYYKGNAVTENYTINGFYQDNNGTVWFPHSDGLAYFKPFVAGFGLLRSNAVNGDKEWNNEVRSITEDDKGNIWFGTANGFCRRDKNTGHVRSWVPDPEKKDYLNYMSVRSIGYDNGKIIVGQSERGFWIFDPATETFKRPFFENDSTRQKFLIDFNNNMVRLKNGNFLVLSRNCWLIEKGTYRVKEIIFEGSTGGKRNVLEDDANRLWFATDAGIVITDNNFQNPILLKNAATGRWLNAIIQIDAETFWASAKTLYEIKFKNNKTDIRPLFPELKAEHFSNLFKDSLGHIWMNSMEGIYRYIPSRQSLEKFDYSDNVQGSISTVCNEFRSSDGKVYFGTVNGINFFEPEKIPLQNDSLEVHLLNVTVNEDDSTFLQNGSLPALAHAQNSLVFDFISPYLYNAEKVQYRYRMQGAGEHWVNIGNNNSVRFTSLKPGEYNFQVAASLNGRDWFQAGSGFSFIINPPFWQTWWFLGLLVSLTVAGIYSWIYSLRQRIRSEKILNQYATSLYGQNTIEDIFWDTAKNCVEKLGLVDCVIYQKETGRNLLVQKAAFGPKNPVDREILIPIEIPLGKGIVGAVAQTGKAELIGNTARDSRYIVDDEVRLSEIAVPIFIDGHVFGVIDSEHPQRNFYTRYHLQLLQKIAAICAERISKYLTEERLRSKIARDLHDEMGSTLTSINIISKMAMQGMQKEERVIDYLQKINSNSGRMMESMSDIVWAINPANDNFEKVLLRMKEFAAEILEPAHINYYFNEEDLSDLNLPLNLEQRKNIYMVFKEALNNAVKYSHATEVNITLKKKNGRLEMKVIDNGSGFEVAKAWSGNGIRNMHSRAEEMNAALKIDSIKDMGTTIALEMDIT